MPVVSQVIPNFYQGISQQVPTQRYINQGEEQINFQNDIVRCLTKRPPMEYIKTLETTIFSNKIKLNLIYQAAKTYKNEKYKTWCKY